MSDTNCDCCGMQHGIEGHGDRVCADLSDLRAENERLRSLLREWFYAIDALQDTSVMSSIPKKMARIKECEQAARAALSGEAPDGSR